MNSTRWLLLIAFATLTTAFTGCADGTGDAPDTSTTEDATTTSEDATSTREDATTTSEDATTTEEDATTTAEDATTTTEDATEDATTTEDATAEDATQDATTEDATEDATTEDAAEDTTTTADGETCDVAIDATAGGSFTGDTTGAGDDYDAPLSADGCPNGSISGGDIIYALSPTAETTYDITVTPDGSSYDPLLYLRSDCTQDACIDGTVFNGAGEPESLNGVTVAAGDTVFIIVDGELGSEGSYTLDVSIPDTGGPDGETCDVAIDVTAGGSFTGTLVGANDDYETNASDDGCPNGRFSGGDRAYVVSPSTATTYRATVTPDASNFDPFIYARANCADDVCIEGSVLNGAGTPESITFSVLGGETAFIIVDGELGSEGSYTLDITLNP